MHTVRSGGEVEGVAGAVVVLGYGDVDTDSSAGLKRSRERVLGWGDVHRPSTALAVLVETTLEGPVKGHTGAPGVLCRPAVRRGVGVDL